MNSVLFIILTTLIPVTGVSLDSISSETEVVQESVNMSNDLEDDTPIIQAVPEAVNGINRPNIDDKVFHFGFQLGLNFDIFALTESQVPVNMRDTMDILHVQANNPMLPGLHIGFVFDVRLCKYVNLRFTPGIQFTSISFRYTAESGREVHSTWRGRNNQYKYGDKIGIMYAPIYLPLSFKFSTPRYGNLRPYLLAGGGVSFNFFRQKDYPIMFNTMDYFCKVGLGLDVYLKWFKWCPEVTYRLGFADQLDHNYVPETDGFYSQSISRLQSHCICLTFNFE